jgi:glycolate oxidase FAD binding subunit
MKPPLVLEPVSPEAVAKTLSFCSREGLAVVPYGGGTRLHVGNLPARLDCYLSAFHLKGVEDYEPADSTVTVHAGTPLRDLQALLAKERQFIPWDPPSVERATVGGVLASGEPGFRRQPGARPRDLLLGFDALLSDGTSVSAGGRVVKNVAGYELMKLLVGSRGTLAFLTRVHLRVRPIPETTVTLAVSLRGASSVSDALSVHRSNALQPEVIAVIDPSLAASLSFKGWLLLLRYEGIAEEVSDHCGRSEDLLRGNDVTRPTPGESDSLWDRLRDFPASSVESPIVVLGQVLPSRTVRLAEKWQSRGPIVAYPDAGLVYASSEDPGDYPYMLSKAQELEGNAVLEAGPREVKARLDVFGERPGGFELMKKIKEKLDPDGIFSPGRFVGRL